MLQCDVEEVRFQQVIVGNLEIAVLDNAFKLTDHGRKVFTLPYVVRLPARVLQVVDQILRGIAVVPDLQDIYSVLIPKHRKPFVNVAIIDVVFAG